jgi:hypothetical protein
MFVCSPQGNLRCCHHRSLCVFAGAAAAKVFVVVGGGVLFYRALSARSISCNFAKAGSRLVGLSIAAPPPSRQRSLRTRAPGVNKNNELVV